MTDRQGDRPPEVDGLPCLSPLGERRQARLHDARLAVRLFLSVVPDGVSLARALCSASADLLLVDALPRDLDRVRAILDQLHEACQDSGGLLIVHGPPLGETSADGYHLASEDDIDTARRQVGPDVLLGRTIADATLLHGEAELDLDYLAVAPALVPDAVRRASHPWFVEVVLPADVDHYLDAGARRILVDAAALGLGDDVTERTWGLRRALGRYH